MTFDATAAGCWNYLNTSWALTFSGVPSGYGSTGTIAVTDGGCGAVIATQPYLAPFASGWGATRWGALRVENGFSINITWGAPEGLTNSSGLASDHPLAGPTGPTACGTCYPSTRVSNSRYHGAGGAYCPSGTTLSDGLCDIELMIEATVQCVIGVEDESWGKVKNLYR